MMIVDRLCVELVVRDFVVIVSVFVLVLNKLYFVFIIV